MAVNNVIICLRGGPERERPVPAYGVTNVMVFTLVIYAVIGGKLFINCLRVGGLWFCSGLLSVIAVGNK